MSDVDRRTEAPFVVGIGEILWDLLPGRRLLGGAPTNFACNARRLGARAAIISAVGRDPLGRAALDQLHRLGIDTGSVALLPDHATGIVDVTVGADGEPDYRILEPAAWDFIPATPAAFEAAASADAICYGTLAQRQVTSRATIRTLNAAALPRCLRVLDVNLREPWVRPQVIVDLLERSNVAKLNESELTRLAGILGLAAEEGERIEQLAQRYRLRLVAVTKGRSGCRLFAAGRHAEHPGFLVDDIVDTVGAGDAFTAAMVVGMLSGLSLQSIAETSNRFASEVCRGSGASATTSAPTGLVS